MSRIYFHTPSETVEVYGSERAHLGQLCSKLAAGAFDILGWKRKLALLPKDWQGRIGPDRFGIATQVDQSFRIFLTTDGSFADGESVFTTILNTVLRLGSDPMALAARIHGQCELHGYAEPEDGEFFASLIEEGLGIFREFLPLDGAPTEHPTGWREVCRVLRAGEIVVSSYSVCDLFPNPYVSDHEEGSWYDLPKQERWDLAVKALRADGRLLRWSRDDWRGYFFDHGKHALDYDRRGIVDHAN